MSKHKDTSMPPFYVAYWYLLRQCFAYVGTMKRAYISALVLLVVAQVLFRLNPIFLGEFLNTLQMGGPEVLRIGFFWLALYLIFDAFPWFLWKPARQWERTSALEMRQNFYDRSYHILRHLPIKWHQDHHSGNTINRLRKAGDALLQFAQDQYAYEQRVVTIITTLIVLFWYSFSLAILAVFCMFLSIWIVRWYDQRLGRVYTKENEYEHHFFEGVFDYVSNMMTVITLRLGARTQKDLYRRHGRIKPYRFGEAVLNENKYLVLSFVVSTFTVIVLGGYTWLTIENNFVRIGTLVMMFQYFNALTDSCYFLAHQMEKTTKWYNDFKAAEPILTAVPSHTKDAQDYPTWSRMAVKDLSFAHGEGAPLVVNHIDFAFHKGQKIAVIGESGSGKSTLMAMMRGVYEPQTGTLDVDGARQDDFYALYDRITLIPQEPEIFENTIWQNLTLGIDYPRAQVEQAVRMAAFDRVVEKLPKGYDSDIREKGVNLSGGEKQRLALSRGLLAGFDSDILVMDEPTSSLDIRTEAAVLESVFDVFKDKTLIVAVHRLHVLPQFDRIWVMDRGSLIADGTFPDLMAAGGAFAELWRKYQGIVDEGRVE